jgi:4a-hydroxytetrahydrobiopterin dehydratase
MIQITESWREENNRLQKTYLFADFESAMSFMQKAVAGISKMDHHPSWTNVYNKVEVTLTTHDAGNIVTDKDRALAELLDGIYLENSK